MSRCRMALGKGDLWHARCHTDKLHERLLCEEDMCVCVCVCVGGGGGGGGWGL